MHCKRCTPSCMLVGSRGGLPDLCCAVSVAALLSVSTRNTKSRARLLTRQCAHTNDSKETGGSAGWLKPCPAQMYWRSPTMAESHRRLRPCSMIFIVPKTFELNPVCRLGGKLRCRVNSCTSSNNDHQAAQTW